MINRPIYLQQLINFKDKGDIIKVITGIRRCGKSSILALFVEHLKKQGIQDSNIIQINFEDLQYANMSYTDLNEFVKQKIETTSGKIYLLFDEIQKVNQWELAINSLRLDNRTDIYITGSNAYLLSSQLSTYLSGRYVEIKMRPLSFKEFLEFHNFNKNSQIQDKFDLFLQYGGMPALSNLNFNEQMIHQTLEGTISTVVIKDIIDRSEVRDAALLNKIINFLADNIGNNTSSNKIKERLISNNIIKKSTTSGTIDNYIMLLENAYIFYHISRYDIKSKEYLKTQGKYYIVDIGLRNQLLGYRNIDKGHILENIIFLELLNRSYNVSIGKINNQEVDFIATKANEKLYIQVTQTMLDETIRTRELTPLKAIKDNYEKIVLTADNIFVNTDDEGIKILNVIDWLLK